MKYILSIIIVGLLLVIIIEPKPKQLEDDPDQVNRLQYILDQLNCVESCPETLQQVQVLMLNEVHSVRLRLHSRETENEAAGAVQSRDAWK